MSLTVEKRINEKMNIQSMEDENLIRIELHCQLVLEDKFHGNMSISLPADVV